MKFYCFLYYLKYILSYLNLKCQAKTNIYCRVVLYIVVITESKFQVLPITDI